MMMYSTKRFFALLFATAFLFAFIPARAEASEVVVSEVEYLPDGGYIETIIFESVSRASGTKTGTKMKRFVDSAGDVSWVIRLEATFSYNGTSANCTKSSCDVTIYADNWYVVNKSATKSGASAFGEVVMGKKMLGITVSKTTYELTLNCDKNGNLS